MKEQRLNIKLFKKVRKRIAEVPESYRQTTWATDTDKSPCGTAACIGGEALICSKPSVKQGIKFLWDVDVSEDRSVFDEARHLLGLTLDEANCLFNGYAEGWPERFRKRYHKAKTHRGRANAAVAYLDHIIETGEVIAE